MGRRRLYDVVAVTGTYKDRNGDEKQEYLNCGVVLDGDKCPVMRIKATPVGPDWNGWLMLLEPRGRDGHRGSDGGGGNSDGDSGPAHGPF